MLGGGREGGRVDPGRVPRAWVWLQVLQRGRKDKQLCRHLRPGLPMAGSERQGTPSQHVVRHTPFLRDPPSPLAHLNTRSAATVKGTTWSAVTATPRGTLMMLRLMEK
jgi:hypothetical protein